MSKGSLALILAAAALGGACRGKPPEQNAMAIYQEPKGLFSCSAPASWRALENQGGAQKATFLGPPEGPRPYSASIGIYHYPAGSSFSSQAEYAASQAAAGVRATPLAPAKRQGAQVFTSVRRAPTTLHGVKSELRREDTALIPAKDGFYAVVHSAPEGSYGETEAAFEALVESFRLP